ncbi:MAG TPA: alpha/beta fold hydrolase [Bacteroidales bacterium]|nr:alpha/beta fold hydrolase [Bacteroidales bacterium]
MKTVQQIISTGIILCIILCMGCSNYLANSLMKPRRQPLVKSPGDYGLPFQNIEFKSADGVNLKGWLIPGKTDKLIVVTHPMTFTKYGYSVKDQGMFKVTKIEVQFLNTVKHLNDAGYNVLMFDFRNHGESDAANNGYSAVGLFEWQDVAGAMDYIQSNNALKHMKVGFVSHCMGANSTIIAMSKAKEKFKDVTCLVAIQPVSANVFTQCFVKNRYPSFARYYEGMNNKIKKETGYYFDAMSPKDYVKDVAAPVMYVQVEKDPWTTKADIESFYNNTLSEKKILWLEGNERFEGYNYFGNKPDELLKFLKLYM